MISEKRIFKVLGNLYGNAEDGSPDAWQSTYNELADIFNSGPGSLSLYLTAKDDFKVLAANTDFEIYKEYAEYFQFVSPFRDKITKLKAGEYFSRVENCPDDDFVMTEIYQDHFRKHDVFQYEYHVLCSMPGITGGVSFSRPKSRVHFSPNERKALEFILPHLQRAFHLHLMLTEARRENQQMTETLRRIHQSVIVVDRSAKIVFLNAAAEKIIEKKDGLAIDRSRTLFANSSRSNRDLRAALNNVFDPINGKNAANDGVLQISRPSGLRPLQLQLSPFTERVFKSYTSDTLALLFVYDPEQKAETIEEVLCQVYGLTHAEARLSGHLAHGASVKEACSILGITENTCRTHLKHIFSKTETSRQSELIQLILNGPGHVTKP